MGPRRRSSGALAIRRIIHDFPTTGPGAARAAPRRLTGPPSPPYRGYGRINCHLFLRTPAPAPRLHGHEQDPTGCPSAIRVRRDGCIGRATRHDSATMSHHRSEADPPMNSWDGEGEFGRCRWVSMRPPFFDAPKGHLFGTYPRIRNRLLDSPSGLFMSVFPNFIHGGLKWGAKSDPYPLPRIKPAAARFARNFQNIL